MIILTTLPARFEYIRAHFIQYLTDFCESFRYFIRETVIFQVTVRTLYLRALIGDGRNITYKPSYEHSYAIQYSKWERFDQT